ncbi:MAG: hypothetical protein LBO66_03845 [Deltaproteobacteria bacterium]|nr:hypothetical protein [Deltaproteobacteria bacterium]
MTEIFKTAWPQLSEKEKRLFAAAEAKKLGYGGVTLVSSLCGLSRATISKGVKELDSPPQIGARVRKPGAGRPPLAKSDPELISALNGLLARETGAAPQGPLSWTQKSTRTLAKELVALQHPISYVKVGQLLKDLGYRLKGNQKRGGTGPDPEFCATFAQINAETARALETGDWALFCEILEPEPRESGAPPPPPPERAEDFAAFALARLGALLAAEETPPRAALALIRDGRRRALAPSALQDGAQSLARERGLALKVLYLPRGAYRWNLAATEILSVEAQESAPAAEALGKKEKGERAFALKISRLGESPATARAPERARVEITRAKPARESARRRAQGAASRGELAASSQGALPAASLAAAAPEFPASPEFPRAAEPLAEAARAPAPELSKAAGPREKSG